MIDKILEYGDYCGHGLHRSIDFQVERRTASPMDANSSRLTRWVLDTSVLLGDFMPNE